ncbi:hypothetical protein [Mucilaginibacter terrae]|uniref:Uncharacterized protein n=1 Tax=Mucilaginibacter terrae TaxID=1955052 RepID=A0ABU3GZY4_9SPHI|nr:hypothetical protein [Mucilaginibacter terrae]MDT3404210.1 hypothetical protein [Mucilaginibacter terrae]
MKINPSPRALNGNQPDPAVQDRINKVTRIVAIVVAFVSTFFLMIKIMFL